MQKMAIMEPQARAFAQPSRRKSRCRWPARSTPTRRDWPKPPVFARIYLSGGGVAANSLGIPTSASAPWKTC